MASNALYAVKFRRRREGSTNYRKRLAFLKSGMPRLVVRLSNLYIRAQIVKSHNGQDSVLCSVNSKELSHSGWKHSFKNLPAAYLTGLLIGRECPVKEVVLDAGVSKPSSRVFAVLKGFVDAGKVVPHSDASFPSADRLAGKHINEKVLKDVEVVKLKVLKDEKSKKRK